MGYKSADFRSPLSKARGLGSAKEGVGHWMAQRVTAIALLFLSVWFIVSIVGLSQTGAGYQESLQWLSSPLNALMVILFLAVSFHHGWLGLQVVIEDYVHCEASKFALLIATKLLCYLAAFAGILAVFSIYIKGL